MVYFRSFLHPPLEAPILSKTARKQVKKARPQGARRRAQARPRSARHCKAVTAKPVKRHAQDQPARPQRAKPADKNHASCQQPAEAVAAQGVGKTACPRPPPP